MKTASLEQFLTFLNGLNAIEFKTEKVDCFLKDHRIPTDDFLPFMYFREDTYGRNLIAKNENFELLALTWLPEQRTRIHDHFGQRCWMSVTLGNLALKNYHTTIKENGELVSLGPVEDCCPGQAVYVDDDIAYHSIANRSRKPAVSIHLYAGPIPTCNIYNESTRKFELIELQYFTEGGIPSDKIARPEISVL